MERDFKGIWIPKEIWLSKELNIMEKLFLVEIDSLDNEDGCFASNAYFAEFFQLSKNRCSEIIKSLETKGYITNNLIREKGKKNIDKRVLKVVGKSNRGVREIDRPIRKIDQGYSENREDNNTILNNTNITIIWDYYCDKLKALNKIRKKTKSKTEHIHARLEDGFTIEQLKQVLDNVFSNDFMLGKNDNNKMYIEIDNFMCNTEKVEKWLDIKPLLKVVPTKPQDNKCPYCKGEGVLLDEENKYYHCPECNGTGKVKEVGKVG